jgi:hypothetical protein
MADSKQSRLPTEQTQPLAVENPASSEASFSVRLWKKSDPARSPVQPGNPAFSLMLDLISSSLGVLSQPNPPLVSASFPDVAQAILAARRLQWALQGLAQCDPVADLAAAILVGEASDLADTAALESAQASLDHAAPDQILVSAKVSEVLKDIPSFPLQVVPDSALHELVWRSSSALPSRVLDEETIEELIKRHGLESEAPPPPQEPVKPLPSATREVRAASREVKAASRETKAVGAYPTPAAWEQPEPVAQPASRGMNPIVLYAGGGGVAVLIAIVAFFALSHKGQNSAPQAVEPSAAVQQANPAPQSGQPAPKITKSKPTASTAQPEPSIVQQKPSAEAPKDSGHNDAVVTPAQAPDVQPQKTEKTGSCTLNQPASDIPKLLGQADSNRAAGRYEDAVRQYNRVIACDHENSRAKNGLELTHLAMQH